MTIFALLQAFFQAATAYLNLKTKTAYFDILEKFDSRIDALDNKRQILRSKADTASQSAAEDVMAEIIEEKKKLAEIVKEFSKV